MENGLGFRGVGRSTEKFLIIAQGSFEAIRDGYVNVPLLLVVYTASRERFMLNLFLQKESILGRLDDMGS